MIDSLLTVFTIGAMIVVLFLSIIPFIPGPLLIWLLSLVYAYLTDFEKLPIPVIGGMAVLMVAGTTTDYWMPLLGMRAQGTSCWGSLGMMAGGMLGACFIVIPVPICAPLCGTFIGAIGGAFLFEFMRVGDINKAADTIPRTIKVFFMEMVVEFVLTASILGIFILCVVVV